MHETHNLDFLKKKPSYVGKHLLKYIPENILKTEDKLQFNKALKMYLTNNPLYSLEELSEDLHQCFNEIKNCMVRIHFLCH